MNKSVSVIISVYNEEKDIQNCLRSLQAQTRKFELIIVDDGSTDKTNEKILSIAKEYPLILIHEKHLGPGNARNAGVKRSSGDILVFIDADMTFDPAFITDLVSPIELGTVKGTFTKEEYVSNWENIWAKCWNIRQGLPNNRRIPESYPETAPVFRAILASEFKKVGGFDIGIGWTDDWTLSKKLGYQAHATAAKCYHNNPETLIEALNQAKWIGKNPFISGNIFLSFANLFRNNIIFGIVRAVYLSIMYSTPQLFIFSIVYDLGINFGIVLALITRSRNK